MNLHILVLLMFQVLLHLKNQERKNGIQTIRENK